MTKAKAIAGFIELSLANGDPMLVPLSLVGLVYPNDTGTTVQIIAEDIKMYEVKDTYAQVKRKISDAV